MRALRLLARGGTAEIWLADAPGIGHCVLKRLRPSLRDDTVARRMLVDEGRLMRRLSHPNVVRVLDVGATPGDEHIVLEWLDGIDGAAAIDVARHHRQLAPRAVAAGIVAQIASALAYAHAGVGELGSIVHRDVNPPNFLIQRDGLVKLLDFGVAHAEDGRDTTASGIVKGKEPYLAPEQVTGGAVATRTDVYALGASYHALRAGRPPLSDWLELVARVRGGALSIDACLDDEERALVCDAMAIAPEDRPTACALAARARVLTASPSRTRSTIARWVASLLAAREQVRAFDDLVDFDALSNQDDDAR